MNISGTFLTMAQTAEISQPSLFPFPLGLYAIFCIVATAFFIFRFVKEKAPYQIIMAVAVPLSLLIGTASSKTFFYFIGIVELLLLISALAATIICKKKAPEAAPEQAEATEDEKVSEEEEA